MAQSVPSVAEQDSWTYISRKRGRQRNGNQKNFSHKTTTPHTSTLPNSVQELRDQHGYLTAAEIQSEHARVQAQWEVSVTRRHIQSVLSSFSALAQPITVGICLGLGTFDPADGSASSKTRAHAQLAAFEMLMRNLKQTQQSGNTQEPDVGTPIRSFIQDPVLSPADIKFLKDRGHEVVSSPSGFDLVDEQSLLFGVHLYSGILRQALQRGIPAVFVGTGVDIWERSGKDVTGEEFCGMRELDRLCQKVAFPDENEFFTAFSSTSIFWQLSDIEAKSTTI